MTPNTRTLKGQSYCSQRWANPAWPKGSKSRGFSNNAALAVLKKKKLVPMELLTGVPVEIPQEAVLEREELERQEKELMLKLEKLPKQEIAAIKAVILENKKCVEAALELGMSVNTLKTHLARALKKLRKDYHLSFLFYSF